MRSWWLSTPRFVRNFRHLVMIFIASFVALSGSALAGPDHSAEPNASAIRFSQYAPGSKIQPPLRILSIPQAKANAFSFVADDGVTVLRVDANNSAGTVSLPLTAEVGTLPILTWRWKVDRALEKSHFAQKMKDDHAARVYVFFDVPIESLPLGERTKIRLARAVAGTDVPTAALCYVWDNKLPIGHIGPSPYSARVQKIVLQSGNALRGQWQTETRDVVADFKRAFGHAPPRITGVAVGSDTDQTDEKSTAWFGDVIWRTPPPSSEKGAP